MRKSLGRKKIQSDIYTGYCLGMQKRKLCYMLILLLKQNNKRVCGLFVNQCRIEDTSSSLQVCFKIQIIVFYDIKQMMTFRIFFFFKNVCDYNNLILQYRFCLCMWYVLFRLKSRGQNHGGHQHWHIDWSQVGAD